MNANERITDAKIIQNSIRQLALHQHGTGLADRIGFKV